MPFSRRSTCPPATPAVVFTGALLSITIGAGFYLATAEAIESDAEARFRGMARATQYAIDARIKSYTDVLRGAAGLFHAKPDTSAGEFREYVEQLDTPRNFPGIVALNYARSVRPDALAALDAELRERLRAAGMPAPVRGLVPVPGRDKHTVIVRIEPANPHTLAKLGTDLEESGHLRRLLHASRDGNTITTSGIRVSGFGRYVQGGTVLGMRLPVYRGGMPIETVDQRRAAYLGSVGINFGVDRMVGGVLEGFPVKGVRLVLTDVEAPPVAPGEAPPSPVLHDSHAASGSALPRLDAAGLLTASLPVRFNQREWRADFSIERSALHSRFDQYYPWMAALAGALSTALLYALFQTMASSRRSALRMAGDMTRELRASQAKLQATNEKLRQLAAHAEQIKENERKRIAREIHDELAQNLLALKIEAEMLARRSHGSHGHLHERAAATVRQIDQSIRSVRQIIIDLRPNVLDLGLHAAVDWQVAEFARRTGIACELNEDVDRDADEAGQHLDDSCATALFRILQESLSNVARHAQATRVWIDLHQHAGTLAMTIRDNGIGIAPGSRNRSGSFGLVGIEERINILGGSFSINSGPRGGTTVVVSVPVCGQADAASTLPRQADAMPLSVPA